MHNWISIKEKLPKPMESVLFLTINDIMFVGWLEPNEKLIHPAREGEHTEIFSITHWMPLPKPPKLPKRYNKIMYKVVVKNPKE